MTSYIFKRGNTYHFRMRIPKDAIAYFGQEKLILTLKTKDSRTAKVLAGNLLDELNKILLAIRMKMLTKQQIIQMVTDFKVFRLDYLSEARRRNGLSVYLPDRDPGEFQALPFEEQAAEIIKKYEQDQKNYHQDIQTNNTGRVEALAVELLKDSNLEGEADARSFDRLCEFLLKTQISIAGVIIQRMKGNYGNTHDCIDTSREVTVRAKAPEKKHLLLSEAVEKMTRYKIERKEWTSKNTLRDKKLYYDYCIFVLGDCNIYAITREQALEFGTKLTRLPKAPRIKSIYKDKTVPEIIEIADRLDDERLLPSTINKYIGYMSELSSWVNLNDANGQLSNQFVKMNVKDDRLPHEKTDIYTDEEVQKLIIRLSEFKAKTVRTAHNFWLPLIGFYTGMRLNEICQLWVDDITEFEGYPVFRVMKDEERQQTTKNRQSIRGVPIHKHLIEIGFMDYVEQCRKKREERLWPFLKIDEVTGSHSDNFTVSFGRLRKKELPSDKKLTFHSTRHTISNKLEDAGVPDPLIQNIIGQVVRGSTLRRTYLKPRDIDARVEALNRLDYGLDLALLKK